MIGIIDLEQISAKELHWRLYLVMLVIVCHGRQDNPSVVWTISQTEDGVAAQAPASVKMQFYSSQRRESSQDQFLLICDTDDNVEGYLGQRQEVRSIVK